MKDLDYYYWKKIRLTDNDGGLWEGKVEDFTPAIDNDDLGEDSIAITIADGRLTEFAKSEIKSIEII